MLEFRYQQQQFQLEQQQQQNFQQILNHQQQEVQQRLQQVNQQQQIQRFYNPKTGIRYHIVVPNNIPNDQKTSYEIYRRMEIERLQSRMQGESLNSLLNRNTPQQVVRVNYPSFPSNNRYLTGQSRATPQSQVIRAVRADGTSGGEQSSSRPPTTVRAVINAQTHQHQAQLPPSSSSTYTQR